MFHERGGYTDAATLRSTISCVRILLLFSEEHRRTLFRSFLSLMAGSPGSFFVPTLDIDLAWHTHQLMASRYQSDCLALVGRYVDQ